LFDGLKLKLISWQHAFPKRSWCQKESATAQIFPGFPSQLVGDLSQRRFFGIG
jgi:hypothetical protein